MSDGLQYYLATELAKQLLLPDDLTYDISENTFNGILGSYASTISINTKQPISITNHDINIVRFGDGYIPDEPAQEYHGHVLRVANIYLYATNVVYYIPHESLKLLSHLDRDGDFERDTTYSLSDPNVVAHIKNQFDAIYKIIGPFICKKHT